LAPKVLNVTLNVSKFTNTKLTPAKRRASFFNLTSSMPRMWFALLLTGLMGLTACQPQEIALEVTRIVETQEVVEVTRIVRETVVEEATVGDRGTASAVAFFTSGKYGGHQPSW
jgi:hypothetical protein